MNPEPLTKAYGILNKDDLVSLILWALKPNQSIDDNTSSALRFLIRRILPILTESDKFAVAAAIESDTPAWVALRKDILDGRH
jgi:hypothetical protein